MKENISVEGKIKNIPQKVFLQIGDETENFISDDFETFSEVSWHKERIYDSDIEYVLKVEEPIKEESHAPKVVLKAQESVLSLQSKGEEGVEKLTRVEIIDYYAEKGRAYTHWETDSKIELSYQDGGKTLKIFISKNKF